MRQWDYTIAVALEVIPLIGMVPANDPGGSKARKKWSHYARPHLLTDTMAPNCDCKTALS